MSGMRAFARRSCFRVRGSRAAVCVRRCSGRGGVGTRVQGWLIWIALPSSRSPSPSPWHGCRRRPSPPRPKTWPSLRACALAPGAPIVHYSSRALALPGAGRRQARARARSLELDTPRNPPTTTAPVKTPDLSFQGPPCNTTPLPALPAAAAEI
ncbi:hypothetical protein BU26DRAFT_108490 [Trematosphaeria pertusa]|uniref:Uncharacterized protein n=1 Tax=Trematosphaeria pertusa TaxID=390896 RepID=A0A6A6I192_9PLEO|nr:uncharacterized protein BU26DRAFT_108490 [Trematosphaeria pertusa]KAF2243742.1 hypothetical protein BU26DRAFT_108490 [Trematosphaeria pertusa]